LAVAFIDNPAVENDDDAGICFVENQLAALRLNLLSRDDRSTVFWQPAKKCRILAAKAHKKAELNGPAIPN
jgi:hypothetical protein